MSKEEYLEELRAALSGEVKENIIQETIDYYSRYIDDMIREGKSQDDIFAMLGRGNVVAKSIIEANNASESDVIIDNDEVYSDYNEKTPNKGFHAEFNNDGTADIKYGKFKINSWYGKLLIVLAIIVIAVVVIALIAGAFVVLLYVAVPVALLGGIIYIIVKIFTSINKD